MKLVVILTFLVSCTTTPTPSEELDDLLAHHDTDCGWTSYREDNPQDIQCQNTVATCLPNALAQNTVAIFSVTKIQLTTTVPTIIVTRDGQVLEFVDARTDEFVGSVSRQHCTGLEITMQNTCASASATGCSAPEIQN